MRGRGYGSHCGFAAAAFRTVPFARGLSFGVRDGAATLGCTLPLAILVPQTRLEDCTGFMMKQNSKGMWQKRYFKVRHCYRQGEICSTCHQV